MTKKKRDAPRVPPPERSPYHFLVVSYDVPQDRRRGRVRKVLEDYGERVQYSVFECRLRAKDLERLQERLQPIIVPKEDDVRFYHLCESCTRKARIWGRRRRRRPREAVVV
jgi:CRISPR-associated protein Cas2